LWVVGWARAWAAGSVGLSGWGWAVPWGARSGLGLAQELVQASDSEWARASGAVTGSSLEFRWTAGRLALVTAQTRAPSWEGGLERAWEAVLAWQTANTSAKKWARAWVAGLAEATAEATGGAWGAALAAALGKESGRAKGAELALVLGVGSEHPGKRR
jgi:hypothetical protein